MRRGYNKGKTISEYLRSKGYQTCEYIHSSGLEYIDSGVLAADDIGIRCKFFAVNKEDHCVMASYSDATNGRMTINPDSTQICMSWNTVDYTLRPWYADTIYDCCLNLYNSRERTINDVKYAGIDESYNVGTKASTIALFCSHAPTGFVSPGMYNVYLSQITKGNELIRDFIPVYKISTGEGLLYDIVNDKFYENIGAGIFLHGADIEISQAI